MAFAVQAIEKKDLEPSLMSKLAKFATSEMITSKVCCEISLLWDLCEIALNVGVVVSDLWAESNAKN